MRLLTRACLGLGILTVLAACGQKQSETATAQTEAESPPAASTAIEAPVAAACLAKYAFAAGHDRRDEDFFADPGFITGNHGTGNFMAQG